MTTQLDHAIEVAQAHAESGNPLDRLVGQAEVNVLRRIDVVDIDNQLISYQEMDNSAWTDPVMTVYSADTIEAMFPQYFDCSCNPTSDLFCPSCETRQKAVSIEPEYDRHWADTPRYWAAGGE